MEQEMSLYKLDQTMKEVIDNGFTFDEETGEVIFTTNDIEKIEMATTEIKFSKKEIGKDLKSNEDLIVDGVELKTNKNLQIK